MKTKTCNFQKNLYPNHFMSYAKNQVCIFKINLNRFFNLETTIYLTKVINFATYQQEVNTKSEKSYYQ